MEKGIKWRLMIVRILFVFFIMLFEVLLYYGQEPSMLKWYHQPLALRLACYGFFSIVFYFFSGFMIKYKYQKHLSYLKEIIKQME